MLFVGELVVIGSSESLFHWLWQHTLFIGYSFRTWRQLATSLINLFRYFSMAPLLLVRDWKSGSMLVVFSLLFLLNQKEGLPIATEWVTGFCCNSRSYFSYCCFFSCCGLFSCCCCCFYSHRFSRCYCFWFLLLVLVLLQEHNKHLTITILKALQSEQINVWYACLLKLYPDFRIQDFKTPTVGKISPYQYALVGMNCQTANNHHVHPQVLTNRTLKKCSINLDYSWEFVTLF